MKSVSFLTLQQVKTVTEKYRPSKSQLMNCLLNYLEEELSKQSSDLINLAPTTVDDDLSNVEYDIKYLPIDSVLTSEQIALTLNKCKHLSNKSSSSPPVVIIYNQYRSNYVFFTSADSFKPRTKEFIDTIVDKLLKKSKERNSSKIAGSLASSATVLVNKSNLIILKV
jgi:hypothetical protein